MAVFTVNGEKVEYTPKPGEEKLCLLDYLRNELNLTGTKRGCEERVCGACTVLVDGKAKKACSVMMSKIDGLDVVTVEGLEKDGVLHPMQAAFVEYNAVQCGFCTPGLIMGAIGLVNENPNPTDEDIKKALKFNLCRCGTYPRVIDAIKKAAAIMRGDEAPTYHPADMSKGDSFIGKSMPRLDLPDKVTGRAVFYGDLRFNNMMYGKAVYAEYPHANVLSVDTSEAEAAEGVQVVLTAKDVPGKNRFGVLCQDQPVFCDKRVKYIGDTIAVVFADTQAQAEEAASRVKVEYEVLPTIGSIEQALAPDAVLIPDTDNKPHPMAYICGEKGNVCKEVHLHRGKVEEAFDACAAVIDEEYVTKPEEHAWIEIDGAVSAYDENGIITVYAPNQSPFADLDQLAGCLGLPVDQVRIVHMQCGGAFGGKTELTTHVPCAIATMKTGRPASMVLTRKDSLRTHPKRHPYDMKYKVGADKDGKIIAMTLDAMSDAGAYASWSPRVLEQGVSYSTGPYYVPNFDLSLQGIYTNNMVKGAMRGFGAIQTHFGAECAIDELAAKLGMDPLELRFRNALDRDLPMTTGQYPQTQGIDYKNTIRGAQRIIEQLKPELEAMRAEGRLVGIGVASGWRSVAGGLGPAEDAGAKYTLNADGRVTLSIACTEMGQGSHTSLAQMAAEVTGVAWSDIDIVAGDTKRVPHGGGVMASRGLYLWGHPTIKAGGEFREKIVEAAATILDVQQDSLKLDKSQLVNPRTGECVMTLAELAQRLDEKIEVQVDFLLPKSNPVAENVNEDHHIPDDEYHPHQTVGYNTTVAMVEVMPEKGDVHVHYLGAVVDGGRIVNPDAATTQIEGALIMGQNFGLFNNFKIEDGVNVTNSLGKCKIPKIDNIADRLDVHFTDATDSTGPFGSKGIAEVAILTPAPAICNAIYNAIGLRIREIPVCDHADEIKEAAQRALEAQGTVEA